MIFCFQVRFHARGGHCRVLYCRRRYINFPGASTKIRREGAMAETEKGIGSTWNNSWDQRPRYTKRTLMSDGFTPEIRDACEMVTGWMACNFSRASKERDFNLE